MTDFDFMVRFVLGEDEYFTSFGVANPPDIRFRGEKDGLRHQDAGEAMFVPLLIITTY